MRLKLFDLKIYFFLLLFSKNYAQQFVNDAFMTDIRLSKRQDNVENHIVCLSSNDLENEKYSCNQEVFSVYDHIPILGVLKGYLNIVSPAVITTFKANGDIITSPEYGEQYDKKNKIRFYPNRIAYRPNDNTSCSDETDNCLLAISRDYYTMDLETDNLNDIMIPKINSYGLTDYSLYINVSLAYISNPNYVVGSREMHIPIFTNEQKNNLDRINHVASSNSLIRSCLNTYYQLNCEVSIKRPTEALVLGYGIKNNPDTFPIRDNDDSISFNQISLQAYYIMMINGNEIFKQPVWYAADNSFPSYNRHPRNLLEDLLDFTIFNEINSEEEYGHEPDKIWHSEDDGYYSTINYEFTKLDVYKYGDEKPINSIDFDPYKEGHFHNLKLVGKELQFISKTENGAIAHKFGSNCLTNETSDNHHLIIENNTGSIILKSNNNNIVWEKKSNDSENQVSCKFPTIGQSKLNINEELIQYNLNINHSSQKTYLLSEDKNYITIKDSNFIKVIDKNEYEKNNGIIENILPIQIFSLN